MSLLSFGPEVLDLSIYEGDSFKLSVKILGHDGLTYATTGSWKMSFYNKENNNSIDTNPTGISISPIGNGFKINEFNYVATANQTTFSGPDQATNTLSYIVETTNVYKNNVLIASNQYTATNGTSIVLNSGAAVDDKIKISCISSNTADGITEVSISNELTTLLPSTASVIYNFYLDNGIDKFTFLRGNVSFTEIGS